MRDPKEMFKPRVLVADLDNTLLGDEGGLARFAQWRHTLGKDCRLVYATGRFFRSVLESIRTGPLPGPDAVISGVGTEIRAYPSGIHIGSWREKWFANWDRRIIERVIARHEGLIPQPREFQSEDKVSYFFHEATAIELLELRSALTANGVRANIIYSSNRDLDIVPWGVNKGSAASFLMRKWSIPHHQVVVSGDSGNDLEMFLQGFYGIVVGNADSELKRLTGPTTYCSKLTYADGVVDGLQFWGRYRQPEPV